MDQLNYMDDGGTVGEAVFSDTLGFADTAFGNNKKGFYLTPNRKITKNIVNIK